LDLHLFDAIYTNLHKKINQLLLTACISVFSAGQKTCKTSPPQVWPHAVKTIIIYSS